MELVDQLGKLLYGMTRAEAQQKGICISCKKPPDLSTKAAQTEYQLSGLCEPCFEEIAKEMDE